MTESPTGGTAMCKSRHRGMKGDGGFQNNKGFHGAKI